MYILAPEMKTSGPTRFARQPSPAVAHLRPRGSVKPAGDDGQRTGLPQPRRQPCACGGQCPRCSLDKLAGSQLRRQQGGDRQPPGPTPGGAQPANPTGGNLYFCSPALYDIDQIRTAVDTARQWVRWVIPVLSLFKMSQLSGSRETAVRVALRDNFNITEPRPRFSLSATSPLDTILANFATIERALSQPMQFWCTTACLPGDLAWVFSNPQTFGLPPGVINLCPEFFGCDPLKQASTIIHERAHEAIQAEDHAYEVRSLYDVLATSTALQNADSYAVFARQVFHDGIHGPGLSCSVANSRFRPLQLSQPRLEYPRPEGPRLFPQP